jgi:RNA polymerase sigma-70 factor (ECF subfamily)
MAEKSDQEIIRIIHSENGRDAGFNLLVNKYQQRIYWHVRRMVIAHEDADDLVQNIFVKIFHNLGSFRNDSSLYTWIYRITVNETITFLKQKQRRQVFIPLSQVDHGLMDTIEGSESFSGDEIQRQFQKAILSLPRKQRLVFNMKYFEDDLTFEDLSAILGTSVGALKASYHIAVKKIEKFISEN